MNFVKKMVLSKWFAVAYILFYRGYAEIPEDAGVSFVIETVLTVSMLVAVVARAFSYRLLNPRFWRLVFVGNLIGMFGSSDFHALFSSGNTAFLGLYLGLVVIFELLPLVLLFMYAFRPFEIWHLDIEK